MKILLSRGTTFAKAYEDLEYCKQNKQMRYEAMAREKFLMDQRSRLSSARNKGLENGKAIGFKDGETKGKADGKVEDALRMLEHGMAPDVIADITGLNPKELQDLATAPPSSP